MWEKDFLKKKITHIRVFTQYFFHVIQEIMIPTHLFWHQHLKKVKTHTYYSNNFFCLSLTVAKPELNTFKYSISENF